MSKPKAIHRVGDLTPDARNTNKHTERGTGMMEKSLRGCGFGDSLTVDRNGVVISGNQRLETLASLGMDNPIVVQSDGTRPIVHQRTDLDITQDKRAVELAIFSNRVGELNLDWDPEILRQLDAGIDLDQFFSEIELKKLLGEHLEAADFECCSECGRKKPKNRGKAIRATPSA